jgi:alkanesulfonate monooxygenase SsuD/methylene tetrahydromethanopterin reductase-like flavin-dependent oxidoreductase (luciferase family)
MFRREWDVALLPRVARDAEAAGIDELWVVEDLGYHGGFTQAAAALAATQHLGVGLGIAPAVVRNVAYVAMEVATLAHLHPGRFHMGLGHGVAGWIEQVGATPASFLAALRETTRATVALTSGERVSMEGRHVRLRDVSLHMPPATRPLVSLGVRGPKSMEVVREEADGVILAEWSGPRYVAAVREAIGPDLRLTVFVTATPDLSALEGAVAALDLDTKLRDQGAPYAGCERADLVGELGIVVGRPGWRARVAAWRDAGANTVVLTPLGSDPPSVVADLLGP